MSPRDLRRRSLMLLGAAALVAGRLSAQGIEGQVGRFYEGGGWDVYRLGMSRGLTGPLGLGVHGSYLKRSDGGEGGFAGLSLDLTAFKGAGQGPYLVAGVGAGVGSPGTDEFSDTWGSWSVGAGYQLLPASFLAFGAETRWRELSLDARDGFEVAAGLSIRFGGRRAGGPGAPRPPPAQPVVDRPLAPSAAPPGPEGRPRAVRESVVATAKEAMGRPYVWGGTGAGGGGFDCSGLIQHAYAQHGIALPRTSREQARHGRAISRKAGSLREGDVLTFSNSGGPVTHVGLYIGDGRFIHSASRGVQVSVLSAQDPYGRWWYNRWVGVRRILED